MTHIPAAMRRLVIGRANNCCEYCLLHKDDGFIAHEVDHVIAEKHRGKTEAENLCFACFDCNRFKGSDLSSLDIDTDMLVPLFNPRKQEWDEHFRLDGALIYPLTPEGRVTEYLLQLNNEERIIRRSELIDLQRYPCER
jgi:hypothetical protein